MTGPRIPYVHVGCGTIAPPTWHNLDASWNARLAKWPRLRRALRPAIGASTDAPWPRDIHVHDVLEGLPFAGASLKGIYASHFIEHLTHAQAWKFLPECSRALEPGGIIRLVTPDLHGIASDYLEAAAKGDPAAADSMMSALGITPAPSKAPALVLAYRRLRPLDAHKHVYDYPGLERLVRAAGFREARRRAPFDSALPNVRDVEREARVRGAFAIEAVRA